MYSLIGISSVFLCWYNARFATIDRRILRTVTHQWKWVRFWKMHRCLEQILGYFNFLIYQCSIGFLCFTGQNFQVRFKVSFDKQVCPELVACDTEIQICYIVHKQFLLYQIVKSTVLEHFSQHIFLRSLILI